MKAIEQLQGDSPGPAPAQDPFDELRAVFLARLRRDRMHLAALAAALSCTEGDPAQTFEDIRLFAHRLRGGAAIFEIPEVGTDADALEQAVTLTSLARADRRYASVQKALERLLDCLAIVSGERGVNGPRDRIE